MIKNILLLVFFVISVVLFSMLMRQKPQEVTKNDNNSIDLSNQGLEKLPESVLSETNTERLNNFE